MKFHKKKSQVRIRLAEPKDALEIGKLIYDTVRIINRRDYSEKQVKRWAPDPLVLSHYEESNAYVAELRGEIVGFANLSSAGSLHRLYVHKDHQGDGIGGELLDVIELKAREMGLSEIVTEASLTAKLFFLAKGYRVKNQQVVVRKDVEFINFKMIKKFC